MWSFRFRLLFFLTYITTESLNSFFQVIGGNGKRYIILFFLKSCHSKTEHCPSNITDMKSINENEMKENIAGDGHFSAHSSVFLVFLFSQELHNLRNALVVWYYGSRV